MNPSVDDPTTLSALPPRHALESDSEEDEDAAFRRSGGAGRARRPKPPPVEIAVRWEGEKDSVTLVVAGDEEAGKFVDGYAGTESGTVSRIEGGEDELIGRILKVAKDVVLLVLKPGLPHAVPSPVALAVLEVISPARVLAVGSYVASSYLPSAHEHQSRDDDDDRLRYLSTSASYSPPAGLHPFSPPNHLLSPLAPFLTLLPLSTPPTTLFLLPGPRPTLATLRLLAGVLDAALEQPTGGWDEERFVEGGRKVKWGTNGGRKEVDVGSMYM